MKKFLVSFILIVFILSSFIACNLKNQELKEPDSSQDSPNTGDYSEKNDNDANTSQNTVNNENNNTYNNSQEKFYRAFMESVDSNVYDNWLEQVRAEGVMSLGTICGNYSRLWIHEFDYSIAIAESLFKDHETYLSWKNELEQWLETITNIIKIEVEQISGQTQWSEIGIRKCELIRQKVIDIKYFCYLLEYNDCDPDVKIDNPVCLQWLNDLEK